MPRFPARAPTVQIALASELLSISRCTSVLRWLIDRHDSAHLVQLLKQ